MKAYSLITFLFCATLFSASPAMGAPPPRALMLSKVVSEANAIFKAKVVYAQQSGGSYAYGIVMEDSIHGKFGKRCLLSKSGLRISATYIFMIKDLGDKCGQAGDAFIRALEIRSFQGEEVVVLDNDGFIYPNFGNQLFVVRTEMEGSPDTFVVWTGIKWKNFESHLTDSHRAL